jgi:hypothetical protein
LKLRVPDKNGTTPSLAAALGLAKGCEIEVKWSVMWRFNTTAQPSVDDKAQIKIVSCPKPTVVSATATSSTSVVVTFSGLLDATSLTANGGQFSFDNNLKATAAKSTGPNTVEVTTDAQDGTKTYKVTVDTSLKDTLGQGIDNASNTASFQGFNQPAKVVINEFNPNIKDGCDLIEIRVIQGGSLNGWTLYEKTAKLVDFGSLVVKKNDYIVVHLDAKDTKCAPNGGKSETTSPNEIPQSTVSTHFDTAYDIYSQDSGLTSTTSVLSIRDASGTIQDAVIYQYKNDKGTISSASSSSMTAANACLVAKQWGPTTGTYDKAKYANDAVTYETIANGKVTDKSAQRNTNTDTNTKADWKGSETPTWGKNNPGQTDL